MSIFREMLAVLSLKLLLISIHFRGHKVNDYIMKVETNTQTNIPCKFCS